MQQSPELGVWDSDHVRLVTSASANLSALVSKRDAQRSTAMSLMCQNAAVEVNTIIARVMKRLGDIDCVSQ